MRTFDPKDTPMPVNWYLKTNDVSRTTIWRWEEQGLRILHVGGKRFIRPSDWASFIEQHHAKTTGATGAEGAEKKEQQP